MGVYADRFLRILDNYREELAKADQNRKPGSGLFGFGRGPGDDPCHEEMDKHVAELAAEMAADETDPEETASLVKAVFQAEQSRKWSEAARWSVLAIQRHMLPLISRMDPKDREETAEWYENIYPRRIRVPIQKQIIQELRKKT